MVIPVQPSLPRQEEVAVTIAEVVGGSGTAVRLHQRPVEPVTGWTVQRRAVEVDGTLRHLGNTITIIIDLIQGINPRNMAVLLLPTTTATTTVITTTHQQQLNNNINGKNRNNNHHLCR